MSINQEIENYVIHLKFKENNGSGVVVKPFEESDYCYIFTAKHTFEIEDKYGEKKFISPLDSPHEFNIITSPFNKIKIESLIETPELRDVDILILCVKNYNFSFWDEIKTVKIFSGEFNSKTDFLIGGFPAIHHHKLMERYRCKLDNEDNKNYIITVESKKTLSTHEIDELQTNKGISGGGLFVEGNDGQTYLVGIEIEYEPIQKLKCINLRDIVDLINETIKIKSLDRIDIGGYPNLDEYGLVNKKFDLSILEDELLNDYIKEIKDKSIEFIKDNNNEINRELDKKYKKLLKDMKDIANSYLYRGAVFNGKYNFLATINFKRAIRLNQELEIYLERAKYIRNSDNYKQIDNKNRRDNQLKIDILKAKIDEEEDDDTLLKLYIDLLFYLQNYEDDYRNDIIQYTKELIALYIKKFDFKEAERILENSDLNKNLDREYIRKMLFSIYFHPVYQTKTKLSKKEFADKLIGLIGMFEFESQKYFYIRDRLEQLNIFDDYIFKLREKFIKTEIEFGEYKENIAILSEEITHIKKETKDNHRDNRFLHFSIYAILIGLLFIFNYDEIIKVINFILK